MYKKACLYLRIQLARAGVWREVFQGDWAMCACRNGKPVRVEGLIELDFFVSFCGNDKKKTRLVRQRKLVYGLFKIIDARVRIYFWFNQLLYWESIFRDMLIIPQSGFFLCHFEKT